MTHEQASDLLPWYANATLDEAEHRAVKEHVASCADCTRELAELRALGKVAADLDAEVPEPPPYMLAQALRQVDHHEQQRKSSLWGRLASWWRPTPVFARAALAVQLALIVVLGAALLLDRDGGYEVAGGGTTAPDGPRLTIQFQPTATEAAVREALREVNGTIVSGPSAQGFYTIALERMTDAGQVVEALRAREDLVRYVERQP